MRKKSSLLFLIMAVSGLASLAFATRPGAPPSPPANTTPATTDIDKAIAKSAAQQLDAGRFIFRFDTFGSEAFWGDQLRLHEAIAGEALGGTGNGLDPATALQLGLKVDVDALPPPLAGAAQARESRSQQPGHHLSFIAAQRRGRRHRLLRR